MDGFGSKGFGRAEDHHAPEPQPVADAPATADAAFTLGGDERRMHVRAYNYWVALLHGRDFPSIEDLDPASVADFGTHSVLLDFTAGRDNPATPYIGSALRDECGLSGDVRTIADVPSRSLLSRLTDHYLQIIANRAPIGFEAEFINQVGRAICYRGILMPFSSDGDTIDFIYGVINWKAGDGEATQPNDPIIKTSIDPAELAPLDLAAGDSLPRVEPTHLAWQDGPLNDDDSALDLPFAPPDLGEDAGLADRLGAARDSAEICKAQDGRSRAALYRALAMAYDFAVATKRATDDYAEILEDAGVTAQARAPMTPIVKLVFGIDYDKTRLTEFAAALAFADRSGVDFGGFLTFIESQSGGLKGLVAAERIARRPGPRSDRGTALRASLRDRPAMALADLPTNAEFALVLTRRNAAGRHEVVGLVADDALLDRAIKAAA